MKIKYNYLCLCGHQANAHTIDCFYDNEFAEIEDVFAKSTGKHPCESNCNKFQLNNLDLVEYLVEKKGLI
jgi:hypothetical protein